MNTTAQTEGDETPEETLTRIKNKFDNETINLLLEELYGIDPYLFEKIVLKVLHKMGYGGINPKAINLTKKSGDGGIDGWINEDTLGLEKVYVQAKRNGVDNKISSPIIQNFMGAIGSQHGNKGVLITTSKFTDDARNTPTGNYKIVLIDGRELAEYMLAYDIGVQEKEVIKIKQIDYDFFNEEN